MKKVDEKCTRNLHGSKTQRQGGMLLGSAKQTETGCLGLQHIARPALIGSMGS